MTAAAPPRTVDTDVHCAPSALGDLLPYLDAYWRDYVAEAGLGLPQAQGGAYPAGIGPGGVPVSDPAGLPAADAAVLGCTTAFHTNRNPYWEAALCRALNDWLLERRRAHQRIAVTVPVLDTGAAVREIERVGADPAVVAVLLPVRGDARWGHVAHRPLLRAAAGHGLVATLHAWGRGGLAAQPTGMTHSYLEDYLGNSQVLAQAQLTSLVVEGVFAELPSLRVTVAECGSTWLPAMLWRFDKDWKGVWREVPWVDRPPSRIVRDHVRFTIAPIHLPPDAVEAREAVALLGPELLMHASDHPHDHGPGAARLDAVLTPDERAAVAGRTAARWYGLCDVLTSGHRRG